MKVQVLVATMNQTDYSLLEKMNIQTDAIVINQSSVNKIEQFDYKGNAVKWYTLEEKGVGLSRNTALMRADSDLIMFADDDVVYFDGYEKKIIEYYKKNKKAEVVVFNFKVSRYGSKAQDIVTKTRKLGTVNAFQYGTYCITAKTNSILMNNINFHRSFGGGTKYSCGEDTLFLRDCLKNKLKVYSCADTLGVVNHGRSTWFEGYTDKFFYDKGVLYYIFNRRLAKILSLYHCFKHRKKYKSYGWIKAYKKMKEGIREIKYNGHRKFIS